jgi:hypothetical protein
MPFAVGLTGRWIIRSFEVQSPRCYGRGATCQGKCGERPVGFLGLCDF